MKNVVTVLIPLYRDFLTNDEIISLYQCLSVLCDHDIIVFAPQGLKLNNLRWLENRLRFERFSDRYFSGLKGYNELLLSTQFYRRFHTYEYILIYQLDALVFSDELKQWCSRGYDYIGAPYFAGYSLNRSKKMFGVGNGGFSLRKVETFLNVLSAKRFCHDYEKMSLVPIGFGFKQLVVLRCFLKISKYVSLNYRKLFLKYFKFNEDIFWAAYAQFFVKDFEVPPINEALLFAFECHPRYCYYELTNRKLPFGCHAWSRYDRAFWIDILDQVTSLPSDMTIRESWLREL